MPSRWITQNDFTSGELDPRGKARIDLERFPSALALARNVSIDKLGAMHTRGGWRWVDDVPGNAKVQLVGWQRNDGDYLLALDASGNLHIYDSDDVLEDTLAGAADGFVLSVLESNATVAITPANQTTEHTFAGGAGGHTEAFGLVESPLAALIEPGWSPVNDAKMASVLVRAPAVTPTPVFSRETPTFVDQATAATTWTRASHTFSADADLCIVRIAFEGAGACAVSAVAIDPDDTDTALALLGRSFQANQGVEIWGVYGFTAETGATDIEVTMTGSCSGSFSVDTFISADALPEAQDIFTASAEPTIGTSIEVPDGGFGLSSVGRIDSTSDSQQILFFHEDVETQRLHMTEADGWVFEAYPIEDYPYHAFQAPGVTLDPSNTTGNITLTTSAAHWRPQHVGSIVRYDTAGTPKRIEVTGFTSSTVVDATVLDTLSAHTAIEGWDEQVFSAGRGWPVSGCWHQARLVIGGSRDLRDGFWVSRIGENVGGEEGVSFDLGEGNEDEAIWTRVRADEGANIQYVRSQGPLLILASGTEWIVPQQPLTPTDISFDRQASQGVDRLKPVDLDGAIIYLRAARSGEDDAEGEQPLVHFAWDELSQRYRPSDISVLSQHLLDSPVDMAGARGSTSDANNVLFIANEDGTIASLHLPTIDRPGMTLFDGDLEFYSLAVSSGRLYGAAEFNGAHRIFRMDSASALDASAAFDLGSAGVAVGQFEWLADQDVTVKGLSASGWIIQTATVDGSGAVTVETAVSKGEVGLPFEWKIRLLPPEASPATLGSLKSAVELRAMVKDTIGIEAGDETGRSVIMSEDGGSIGDLTTDPPTAFTGHLRDHLLGGWSEEPITEVGSALPWSATILALNVKVEF